MAPFRRHLRALTLMCLAFQAASLSAFVPRDCCAAHASHASHGGGAAVPAPAEDGEAACPMHRAPERKPECALRGACDGPMSALPLVWSNPAVPEAGTPAGPDLVSSPLGDLPETFPAANDSYPDPPPPRA